MNGGKLSKFGIMGVDRPKPRPSGGDSSRGIKFLGNHKPEGGERIMQDQNLTCKDCGKPFVWTVGEQQFYQDKGFSNPPSRCPDCRSKKKTEMRGGGGQKASYPITCSKCGKQDTVPFEPKGDRPILCRDCFKDSKH